MYEMLWKQQHIMNICHLPNQILREEAYTELTIWILGQQSCWNSKIGMHHPTTNDGWEFPSNQPCLCVCEATHTPHIPPLSSLLHAPARARSERWWGTYRVGCHPCGSRGCSLGFKVQFDTFMCIWFSSYISFSLATSSPSCLNLGIAAMLHLLRSADWQTFRNSFQVMTWKCLCPLSNQQVEGTWKRIQSYLHVSDPLKS